MPSISVIIPVYNRAGLIGPVIEALLNQQTPPQLLPSPIEIIIVDDGSTDNTGDVVRSYPVKYIRQENRGPASARNRGFRESKGEIVAFIDSDCIARPGWLEKLLSGFDSPEVGAVAGSYDIANPESLLSRLIHAEIKWRHSRFSRFIRAFGSYNVAIRREVLEGLGGFDETYRTASGEDNDLSYRLLKAGYKIRFVPQALVAHYHTEKLFKYLKEQFRHAFWRMKLYKDHPEMAKGDDYTVLKDILEMPLAGLSVAGIPFLFSDYFYVEILLFLCLFFLSFPLALRLILRNRAPEYILIMPLLTIRSFVRLAGMIKGLLYFWMGVGVRD
jgi:glycosyltransferase involved in cell wall biosynthesis